MRYAVLVRRHGRDILRSPGMLREKGYLQHGSVSVYRHSFAVAALCLRLAHAMRLRVNERSLVRGALLHDYFLYDWHKPGHSGHGFTHPAAALRNARRDFQLSEREEDMIATHMFPLTLRHMPRYRESVLLCAADKLCALRETFSRRRGKNG